MGSALQVRENLENVRWAAAKSRVRPISPRFVCFNSRCFALATATLRLGQLSIVTGQGYQVLGVQDRKPGTGSQLQLPVM
jgi:hypothetical protein